MFTGTVSIKLSKPLNWEDREISTVDLDFDRYSGEIINRCEKATWASGNMSAALKYTSSEYCGNLAAELSGVPFRALGKLGGDYDVICAVVGAFINKGNPKKAYDLILRNLSEIDDEGFIKPAEAPEMIALPKPAKTS